MIRHWNRLLRTERDPDARRRMLRSRAINTFGMFMTGAVLVVVLITKFLLGAWIAIAAMAVIYVLMLAIRRHYDRVARGAGAGRGAGRCCRRATTPSCWSARCTCRRCGRSPTRRRPGRTR